VPVHPEMARTVATCSTMGMALVTIIADDRVYTVEEFALTIINTQTVWRY
jgi:hypothetical protein